MRSARHNRKFTIFFFASFGVFLAGVILYLAHEDFSASFVIPLHGKAQVVAPSLFEVSVEDIKRELLAKNISFDSVATARDGATLVARLAEGTRVFFSAFRPAASQVSTLEAIVSRLTIEQKKPTEIDLRFEKPIVRF